MEDSTHIDSTKISLYIQQLEFTPSITAISGARTRRSATWDVSGSENASRKILALYIKNHN